MGNKNQQGATKMKKITIQGYPRVGENRELKFALEAYWKTPTAETLAALETTAKAVRKSNYETFKEATLDYTPVNDFSYYDQVLDTIQLVGAVPQTYKALNLSPLDTYFAMARGHKGTPALSLRKWFNTNYHYLMPQLDAKPSYSLNDASVIAIVTEALQSGVQNPTPVLIGPLTFLSLATRAEGFNWNEHITALTAVYTQLFAKLEQLGITTIQLHEPILATNPLPFTQAQAEAAFAELSKTKLNIILQTYFDTVGQNYDWIVKLPVFGIGFDLVDGAETLQKIQKSGFPQDKVLFAGVISGRNIWSVDIEKVEKIQAQLSGVSQVVLSTSCSLAHVPYSLKPEEKLSESIKKTLAFAYEKCQELKALKEGNATALAALKAKRQAFLNDPSRVNQATQQTVKTLLGQKRGRALPFSERIEQQNFNLPPLPTTTIGSFPQTAEVRKQRQLWRKHEITDQAYDTFVKASIKDCIQLQEEIGLDVLVHGEFERNDMVEFFGEKMTGYFFTANAWVQSYGSRCVKPPVIFGDIARPNPMTVAEAVYAQSLSQKPVKGMLTGPITILNWSFVRDDLPREEVCYQLAAAIRQEVLDREKAGIRMIQVDEAALREGVPLREEKRQAYLDWSVRSFQISTEGVQNSTQIHTHMCYSNFNDIMPTIIAMDADVISIENSRGNAALLTAFQEHAYNNDIGPGVYDIHSPNIPTVEAMEAMVEAISTVIPVERLWINPDCGLKTRNNEEVIPSLKNMVKTAQVVREKLKTPA